MAEDRQAVLDALDVPRETALRLDRYVEELRRWQTVKNLVGPGTMEQIWSRHLLDSAQLLRHAPADARVWADLGSGAGLPGLVLAILLRDRPGARVHLVESNGRKCAFLRHAARVCDVPATIHPVRIDDSLPERIGSVDIVTARALAPLPQLLDWCSGLWRKGAIGLFLKGQDVEKELTEASKSWRFSADLIPSLTEPKARIVRIHSATRLAAGMIGDDPVDVASKR